MVALANDWITKGGPHKDVQQPYTATANRLRKTGSPFVYAEEGLNTPGGRSRLLPRIPVVTYH
jgi:hypothetical protein